MWNKLSWLRGNRFIWLLCQSLILLLCTGYVRHVYVMNILPDKQAQESYQPTQCFLISKKLSTKGHLIQRYRADFLVNYRADGVQYHRWVSANGLDRAYARNSLEQTDRLSQFEIGKSYPCWFNPDAPQRLMLTIRHDWFSVFHLVVPAALSMVVFYYFLKTLFYFVDSILIQSRKRRGS